jgi:hypothetical protein
MGKKFINGVSLGGVYAKKVLDQVFGYKTSNENKKEEIATLTHRYD